MLDDTALKALIDTHVEKFPDMCAEDLYLLLHQGVLGPGHEIIVPHLALEVLTTEAQGLDLEVREWEEITETLDADLELVRVHLRPYLRAGGSLLRLHQAVVESAARMHPERDRFDSFLSRALAVLQRVDLDETGFDRRDVQRAIAQAKKADYPPPQHSKDYVEAYSPAYRVVLLETLSEKA